MPKKGRKRSPESIAKFKATIARKKEEQATQHFPLALIPDRPVVKATRKKKDVLNSHNHNIELCIEFIRTVQFMLGMK